MSNAPMLRVSCAALCRIQDDSGRLLLGLNRNRLTQGREIFMPLGGALEFTAPDLLARFDAVPEVPGSRDLRLFLPPRHLQAFRAWFLTRQQRELSPLRELAEELVNEFAVLPALVPADVTIRFRHTFEGEASSGRSGVQGAWTHYLHEVFDVAFVSAAWCERLRAVSPSTGLRWMTPDEIMSGVTADGIPLDGSVLVD